MTTDKQQTIIGYIEENPQAVAREIAEACACDAGYARHIRRNILGIKLDPSARGAVPPARPWLTRRIRMRRDVLSILTIEAHRRSLNASELIDKLIDIIASDGLVNAILDDGQ